jgi:hypothetical protein
MMQFLALSQVFRLLADLFMMTHSRGKAFAEPLPLLHTQCCHVFEARLSLLSQDRDVLFPIKELLYGESRLFARPSGAVAERLLAMRCWVMYRPGAWMEWHGNCSSSALQTAKAWAMHPARLGD